MSLIGSLLVMYCFVHVSIVSVCSFQHPLRLPVNRCLSRPIHCPQNAPSVFRAAKLSHYQRVQHLSDGQQKLELWRIFPLSQEACCHGWRELASVHIHASQHSRKIVQCLLPAGTDEGLAAKEREEDLKNGHVKRWRGELEES